MTTLAEFAIAYARQGIPVLPVRKNGKAPLTKGGFKSASVDEGVVRGFWEKHPNANIGLVPGPAGLVVIDIDGDDGMAFAREHGWLDVETRTALTSKGRHLYFKKVSHESVGNLKPHPQIDVRADSGYVIAPPSRHPSGHVYQWVDEHAPYAPLPGGVLVDSVGEATDPGVSGPEGQRIPEGARHSTLVSLAGSMRHRGMGESEILAALNQTNRVRCESPLSAAEVEKIASSVAELYDPASEDPPAKSNFEDFYAHLPSHQYIHIPTRVLWPAASIDSRLPKIGKLKASAFLDRNRAVEQMTWVPGEPTLIEGRLLFEGGWIDKPGSRCFNLFLPANMELGEAAKADPWVEHLHLVYPEEAQHLERWFAFKVQNPGVKLNHCIVLGGAQGTGKDTIVQGVIPAVGQWNCQEASPEQFMGRFNSFAKSIFLRLSEARDLGDRDRYRFNNRLKTYVASPPEVIRVDEKHVREYPVPNVCAVIITTNYRDGVYLDRDDRRHFVAWTEKTKEDLAPEYFQRIYRWYEDEDGYSHVAAYLHSLDLSDFDPKAPPPKTTAFFAAAGASRSLEATEISDTLDFLGRPGAVTLEEIIDKANETFDNTVNVDLGDLLRARGNRRRIPHWLEEVGYVRIPNPAASDDRWSVYGKRRVVYGRRDLSYEERVAAAQILASGGGAGS